MITLISWNNFIIILQMLPVLVAVLVRKVQGLGEILLLSEIRSCLRELESKKKLALLVNCDS